MDASSVAGASARCCYYALLGVRKNAAAADIRAAYRKLALKWHPDQWATDPAAAAEAKRRFQRIQEAYSVLSDKGKRAMYDSGLFDPLDGDDQDFWDFMQEMLVMTDTVNNEPDTLEDLQKMLEEIVHGDCDVGARVPSDGYRRTRVAPYPHRRR